MKTLFRKSNILHIRTNEGEFEVSNPEVVASSMLFDLNHIPVDFEWPYGVELIDMLQIRVGNEWKNLLYQKEYKGNMESTRTIKLARLLPKEEFKPAQPTPNFPKGGTIFTESAYKEPQDKEPVSAPSESQEEPVLFADWLIKNGWEPQMTEGCWIQYAEEPIMKKTRELYQQFTITRNP